MWNELSGAIAAKVLSPRSQSSLGEPKDRSCDLEIPDAPHHGLDIDHWRAIDRFHGPDEEAPLVDSAHGDTMQAQRVRPVGRSRGENAGKLAVGVRTGVNFQHLAVGFMQPRDHDNVRAGLEPVECFCGERSYFQPDIGSALGALLRRLLTRLDCGSEDSNRAKSREVGRFASGALFRGQLWTSLSSKISTCPNC